MIDLEVRPLTEKEIMGVQKIAPGLNKVNFEAAMDYCLKCLFETKDLAGLSFFDRMALFKKIIDATNQQLGENFKKIVSPN